MRDHGMDARVASWTRLSAQPLMSASLEAWCDEQGLGFAKDSLVKSYGTLEALDQCAASIAEIDGDIKETLTNAGSVLPGHIPKILLKLRGK